VAVQGQRAFIGKVNMNFNAPEGYREATEDSYRVTEEFIRQLQEMQVRHFC
jgi:cytosine/adenosine deaminase-related metal-dependent hydrolase